MQSESSELSDSSEESFSDSSSEEERQRRREKEKKSIMGMDGERASEVSQKNINKSAKKSNSGGAIDDFSSDEEVEQSFM